ncbi:TFIIB-type zinc ribbon-containing protein [Saliphagus sp. LR7]|uniref:DUF7117 family protein n=1 Tax=Saliphagus sp. LR7 TaxID=2282654 RepID=UPI000DF7B676|nr:TFIIB-type zinc ribbon-containing protein [Saliphagus sp. LR7]
MKIRGERECTDCGTRWSYYETGSVGCPACGSLRSVGTGERTEHTDLDAALELTEVRGLIDDAPLEEVAERAAEEARSYVRRRGFVRGGDLVDLDDSYLAAAELRYVADVLARTPSHERTDEGELYFVSLLRDADGGERPPVAEVPHGLAMARGLAYAEAVREYRRDVRSWLEGREFAPDERGALDSLGEHVTRIRMLDGDVSPQIAERLVETARDLGRALRDGDEVALARAEDRLEALDDV